MKKVNKFKSFFDFSFFGYDFVKVTGIVPAMLFYRVKKIYINKDQKKDFNKNSVIIAANHSDFLDPILLALGFYNKRLGIVATKELFDTPIKNAFFSFSHVIKVDKEKPSIKTFKEVKKVVDNGHSIAIFPEGTVHDRNLGVQPYKPGAIMMASMTKAPIYPVYIKRRKHWTERLTFIIGEKFDVQDYCKGKSPTSAEMQVIANKLYEKEKELEAYAKTL